MVLWGGDGCGLGEKDSYFSVCTYNCKNVATAVYALGDLSKNVDVILLQEHWLYDCQLSKLDNLNDFMSGVGKAERLWRGSRPMEEKHVI